MQDYFRYPCYIGALAYLGSYYGPGSGPVYLNDLDCVGSEAVLVNCSRGPFGDISSNCKSHLKDASVFCTTGKNLITKVLTIFLMYVQF